MIKASHWGGVFGGKFLLKGAPALTVAAMTKKRGGGRPCNLSSNRPTGPIQSSSFDVRLSVGLWNVPFHVVHFEAYFTPTSQSRMSKIFRVSKSLGKSAGKKWSQN